VVSRNSTFTAEFSRAAPAAGAAGSKRCSPIEWSLATIPTLWPSAYGDSAAEMAPVLDQALVRQVDTPVSFDDLFAIEAAVFPEGHRYDVGIIWSDADPTPC
jgi:hypothetical protein